MIYARYLVFQLPGIFFAGLVLSLLVRWEQISMPLGWVLFGLWLLKDAVMFPVTRVAFETPQRPHGPEALLGEVAVAQDSLAEQGTGQTGWILVRGELWRAQVREGTAPVAKGDRVRVVDTHERVLVVESPA